MARVKSGVQTSRRHKKILKEAKGYFGSKHRLFKTANEQVIRSLSYSYRDRRNRKRDFRKLWITRINAASNSCGISYSQLMHGLKLANVDVNRKMLSEIAINDFPAFEQFCKVAKDAIAKEKAAVVKAA